MFHSFREQVGKLCNENARYLEIPRKEEADLALPCFTLAKEMRKSAEQIASQLATDFSRRMHGFSLIKAIKASGAYVNFYADWQKIGGAIIKEIVKENGNFGKGERRKEKIIIEYSGPNTNKPLHIGHLRNDSIGMSIGNILEFLGYQIVRSNIINDRGIHICQAMLAYKKFHKNKKPDKKPDHFVGDMYVLYHTKAKDNPGLATEAQELLRKWEKGDREVRSLWKKINGWTLTGIKETYKLFGSRFDLWPMESQFYKKAKPIIDQGMKRGIFFNDEKGNLVAKLEPELPNKIILRADGTSLYITNDLALTWYRFEKLKSDRTIWVVAAEQNLHFKQLFKIFNLLGYEWSKNCYHLSYGFVNLPEGKMKSREGKVIDADDLISDVIGLAKKEIKSREEKISQKELDLRSKDIGLAAIKYYLLRLEPVKDLLFDAQRAVSFEGDTGPYIQYTHARAKSILRKSKKKPAKAIRLEEDEIQIAKKLSQFPWIAKKCAQELKPHYLANYLFELATLFNEFYHAKQVIGTKREAELLLFVSAVAVVLKIGLELLGIKALEKM